jgi:hypothetical protein
MDSLARLVETLDGMSGPAWVQGTVKLAGPLELRAKRDSATTANIEYFRDWLVARSELAPYGDREGTKLDVQVRSTLRLKSRGDTVVTGLPIESICAEIANAFSTEREVVAKLHDVLVYPVGGKFDRHKDTPGAADQLGSLIIGLPCHHEGGWLTLDDGDAEQLIDWSGTQAPDELRWAAIYGDVNHEIHEVISGARITLVYSLSLGAARTDPKRKALVDEMTDAMIHLFDDPSAPRSFVVPCRHLIIAPRDNTEFPLPLEALRGDDRMIADAFSRCGAKVEVIEMLTLGWEDELDSDEIVVPTMMPVPPFSDTMDVTKPIPAEVFSHQALSLDDDPGGWDGEELAVGILAPYVTWQRDRPVMATRKKARALLTYDGMWSATGHFGNEYSYTHVYRIAGLRVHLAE